MAAIICGIDLEGMNVDLEFSGPNLEKDRVIEIGAVLWDTEFNQPVKQMSELVLEEGKPPISQEVFELTGISDELLENWGAKGKDIEKIMLQLKELMERADYIIAHNGTNYDKPMLGAMFNRYGIPMPDILWIDSFRDVEFPSRIRQKSMAMLEHSHGFINPFPHRALTDVLSLLKIISNYDLPRMVKLAKSPTVTLQAVLTPPNWSDHKELQEFNLKKSKVSRAQFKWNPENKTWTKRVHKLLIDEGKISYDFDFKILDV
jgi:DNA polymerase III subunit epsilon